MFDKSVAAWRRAFRTTYLSGATTATAAFGQPEPNSAACPSDFSGDPYGAEDGKSDAASRNDQGRGNNNEDNAHCPHFPVVALKLHSEGWGTGDISSELFVFRVRFAQGCCGFKFRRTFSSEGFGKSLRLCPRRPCLSYGPPQRQQISKWHRHVIWSQPPFF